MLIYIYSFLDCGRIRVVKLLDLLKMGFSGLTKLGKTLDTQGNYKSGYTCYTESTQVKRVEVNNEYDKSCV